MFSRCLLMCAAWASVPILLLGAADKKLPIEETSNTLLDISVTSPLDRDQIQQELGGDLGADIVAIRVTARPLTDKPVQINLDDFLLISGKDGQRSEPYAAGQLAGSDTVAMTPNGQRKGLGDHHPTVGIGGFGLGGGSSSPGTTPAPDFKAEESRDKQENPLLAALNAKILPEKQITEPVTGLLFFQIVGKIKAKDLELRYKGPGGAMALRFRPDK